MAKDDQKLSEEIEQWEASWGCLCSSNLKLIEFHFFFRV
jgi:hypothetical protein